MRPHLKVALLSLAAALVSLSNQVEVGPHLGRPKPKATKETLEIGCMIEVLNLNMEVVDVFQQRKHGNDQCDAPIHVVFSQRHDKEIRGTEREQRQHSDEYRNANSLHPSEGQIKKLGLPG